LLTATLGFMVLAGTSLTTQAALSGDINSAWAAPYDILVRTPGTATSLEKSENLVRPNFLSSNSGRITLNQLAAIRQIAGVQVAAPIAILGYVYWPASIPVDLIADLQSGPELQVFRLRTAAKTEAGLSTIPFPDLYEVVAPRGVMHISGRDLTALSRILTFPGGSVDCSHFDPNVVSCWAPTVDCSLCIGPLAPIGDLGPPGWDERVGQPLLVAGVDPSAEAGLTGINHCVTTGSYLGSQPLHFVTSSQGTSVAIPALLSSNSFIDETYSVQVDSSSQSALVGAATGPDRISGWSQVSSSRISAQTLYSNVISRPPPTDPVTLFVRSSDVQYQQKSAGHLSAQTQAPDFNAYVDKVMGRDANQAPPEAADVWFRQLSQADWNNTHDPGEQVIVPSWLPVGTFNPTCVPGFSSLGAGQFGSYTTPQVRLPNGDLLLPTRSAAGYVGTPPLLLTTLQAAEFYSDPTRYAGGLGDRFITAIRVKVRGVESPGSIAQDRLARVAAAIKESTGLAVDIIRGSSPASIRVDLPAGTFGRAATTVTEPWALKGIAFTFVRAVSAQNLALFGLVLVAALLLVGETAYMSAVRRRQEFGVLRALGWRTRSIAMLIELEMLILGLVTGVAGLVIGIPIALALRLGESAAQIAAVVPVAMLIAGLAGVAPAIAAGRRSTVAIVQSSSTAPVKERRPPRTLAGIAWLELRGQRRAEAVVGSLAVALGSSVLGLVVTVLVAFRGQLDATLLGVYLAGTVQPFHIALAGLTLVVGSIAVAEVVTLSYVERRADLGAMRALGWPASAVVRFLLAQAAMLGFGGGILAAVIVIAGGLLMGAPARAIGEGLVAAVGMSVVSLAIAVTAPLAHSYSVSPADALRGE
jgi:hypothetical protein